MFGIDSKPIVTTVAPTIPVDAANKAPIIVTDIVSPHLTFCINIDMDSNNSSAILDFCNMTPIKTNKGTDISK